MQTIESGRHIKPTLGNHSINKKLVKVLTFVENSDRCQIKPSETRGMLL